MTVHDDIWHEALQEAYASAPTDEVILSTLEIRHPSFTDGAIRVVMDHGDMFTIESVDTWGHYMKLENTAPVQAGQTVFFQACMFKITLPEQRDGALPSVNIELDNVTREMMQYLDDAIGQRAPIEITYREYLASDKLTPQFIMSGLTMKTVDSSLSKIVGTAQFGDLVNKSFPKKLYRPDEFKGLRQ